jgi:hypothetical protein
MTSRSLMQDLRNDLMADLRSAVPPASPSPAPAVPPAEVGLADGHALSEPSAPSLVVRISRQAWSVPGLRATSAGLVLSAGPLRLQFVLSRG